MIQSMTGYGKAVVAFKEKKIHVEIKSLNSKQLDLNTRIAPLYREKEMEMRQMVAEALIRGKVDMSVWVEKDMAVDPTPINAQLVENYYQQIKTIAEKTGIPAPEDWFYTLLRMPDVLTKTDTEELDDEEWAVVKGGVAEALKNLVDFRTQEGAALQKKFAEKIDNIGKLMGEIEPYEKSRVEKIKARIIDGLQQIVCLVQTFGVTARESVVSFYSCSWRPLNEPMLVKPSIDDLLQCPADMNSERFSELKAMLQPYLIEAQLSPSDNSIVWQLSPPVITSDDKEDILRVLFKKTVNWTDNSFK